MCDAQGIETGIDLDRLIQAGRRTEGFIGHPGDSYILRAGKNKDILLDIPAGQGDNPTLR